MAVSIESSNHFKFIFYLFFVLKFDGKSTIFSGSAVKPCVFYFYSQSKELNLNKSL